MNRGGSGEPAIETDPRRTRGPFLCWSVLLLSGIVYGSSFSWMKIAAGNGATPVGTVFWFAAISTCVLGLGLAATRRLGHLKPRLLWFCVPWAILSVVLPNICFFQAASEIPAGLIATGIALVPILTLLGTMLLGRERFTIMRGTGIALGAAAVMMILLPEASLPDPRDTLYVLIAFAGAACYAAEHLYIEARFPIDERLDVLLFVMFAFAALGMLPIALATDSFIVPAWPLGARDWAILSVTAVTLFDYFLITLLIIWAGPVFTSQAAYIVTLAGVMWGIVIFDDSLSLWVWGAIAVLMAGLSLVRPRKAG